MSIKTYTADQMFPDLIGQSRVKKQLGFHFRGYMANGRMPHLMFTAPRGCGKTFMASRLCDVLKWREPSKTKIVFNCSQLRNLRQFWNEVIIPHVNDKDVTVLFDEASEMPKDVMMALLTVLNPNAAGRTSFSYEDYTVDFDFSRQTFLFATTEGQSIFHALMDRMERIDLQDYSEEELGEITKVGMDDYKIDDKAIKQIATVLRGNPRAAAKMKDKIVSYCDGNRTKKFSLKDWEKLSDELDILPLGLLNKELELLRILTRKSETRLTELAAITCLSKGSIQKDYEMFLMKKGLMVIQPAGRSLTAKGREYLKKLDKKK
jgi:Holliday junction resolvasome RuvABC ATP-dependent DNA helicase subunit|tara:strand:- start:4043 stop:5002 length:960 start_codon:yes stop_codon:yes gene_type:complete